jgi:site-specific recombinase XerD
LCKTIEGRLRKADEICERIKIEKPVVYGFQKPVKKQDESILLEALAAMENYADPKTIASYTGMVAKFHNFITGRTDRQATREDALAFINYLFDQKLSPKTIKAYGNNIKSLYNKYIDRHEPEGFKNPFRKLPAIKTSSRSLMYFNDFQIQLIKDYCRKENPTLWLSCVLQYYCFIRPNELRQLKVEYFQPSCRIH